MQFSIIIPVYNVEKYIRKCLESIQAQTFQDFEVIVVNDGSPDHSQDIIDEFVADDSRFISMKKENGGLSDARNFGVKKATGEYILFVDSDDTIEPDLLKKLYEQIKRQPVDLIRFGINEMNECTKKEIQLKQISFPVCSGQAALKKMMLEANFSLEPAWAYAYRKEFFIENKFEYAYGRIHEDFGLTPYILLKAQAVISIPYYGYDYMVRENSIMTNAKEAQMVKRMNDLLYHFDFLIDKLSEVRVENETKQVYQSFLANVLLVRSSIVPETYLDFYIDELKKRNISSYLLSDTLKRRIKKLIVQFSLKRYVKNFERKIR